METRSFFIGLGSGIALSVLSAIGVLAYLYNKGAASHEQDWAAATKACPEALNQARAVLREMVDPILLAHRSGKFTKEHITQELLATLDRESRSSSACAIRASYSKDGKAGTPLEQSPAFAASNATSRIGATLRGIASPKCDASCEATLFASVEDEHKRVLVVLQNGRAN